MEKPQNSTQSIWRKKRQRNAFACVRDRPQANICPALSYSGPAALTPGWPPKGGTPRAVIQTPSGESPGEAGPGLGSWVAQQPSPSMEKFLLSYASESKQRPGEVLK